MVVLWTILLSVGLLALALGLIGLVAGRLDQTALRNRTRLSLLAAVGLLLVFAGSAPPTRAEVDRATMPDTATTMPIRTQLRQRELVGARQPLPGTVSEEQQSAYEQWERQVLTEFEKAEQALSTVPKIIDALRSGALDRFTAWVHLARLKQDTNQARLAVHAVVPPAVLDLQHKKRLQQALDGLNESLLSKRRFIAHLQHHVKTMETTELDRAATEMTDGEEALFDALGHIVWVKTELGLVRETPAATAMSEGARSTPSGPRALVSWLAIPSAVDPPAWR